MFLLEVVSTEGKLFAGRVKKLSVPAPEGEVTILSKHIPLVTNLTMGVLNFVDEKDKEHVYSIGKGLVQVNKEKTILLIENPLSAKKISEKKVLEAQKRAKEILKQKPKGEQLITAQNAFRRSLIDLKLIKKRKRHPSITQEI